MSHFAQMQVVIKDRAALVEALVSCGIPREKIEIHEDAKPLMDYLGRKSTDLFKSTGDTRFEDGDKAHVIIRRNSIAPYCNDVGFYLDKEKSVAFMCNSTMQKHIPIFKNETGRGVSTDNWLKAVKQNYALNVAKKHYSAQGKKVHVEKDTETGKMHLYVRA